MTIRLLLSENPCCDQGHHRQKDEQPAACACRRACRRRRPLLRLTTRLLSVTFTLPELLAEERRTRPMSEPKQASTEPCEASAFLKVTHPASMHLYIHVRVRRRTPSMAVRFETGTRTSLRRLPLSSVCRGKNLHNKADLNKVTDDSTPYQEGRTPDADLQGLQFRMLAGGGSQQWQINSRMCCNSKLSYFSWGAAYTFTTTKKIKKKQLCRCRLQSLNKPHLMDCFYTLSTVKLLLIFLHP